MNPSTEVLQKVEENLEGISYLCGEQFWNLNQSWNSELPDLGFCMERTILIWIPSLLLWVLAPLQIALLYQRQSTYIPWTYLTYAKMSVTSLLMTSVMAELIWAIILSTRINVPLNEYLAPTILLCTYGLQAFLMILSARRGARTSGIIFCYWVAVVVCGIPQLMTTIVSTVNKDDRLHILMMITFLVQYTGSIILFVLNCFADHSHDTKSKTSFPEKRASFISKMTFHWANGLVWLGYRRTLTADDIWDLPSRMSTVHLDKLWDSSSKKELSIQENKKIKKERQPNPKNLSVLRILIRCFFWRNLLAVLLYISSEFMVFASPRLLSLIIDFTMNEEEPAWHGYFYAILLFVSTLVTTIVKNVSFFTDLLIGGQVQSTVMSAVYRKAMMLSNTSRRESTLGEIVNLMAIDSQRLRDALLYLNIATGAPFVVSIALYELWQLLGPSSLAGLLVLILLVPVNSLVANKIKVLQTAQMKYKDKRIKLLTEIINSVKVLKLYAWEESFAKQVETIRSNEIKVLKKSAYFQAFSTFLSLTAPYLVALSSFVTFLFVSDDNVLTAKTAFVAISLINIMRMHITMVPTTVAQCIQANVSLKRLGRFLGSTNLDESSVCQDREEKSAIAIHDGHFSWGTVNDEEPWKLTDVDVTIGHGSLVAVVGSVGSGKSSLISAMLGEMQKEAGRVVVNGSVAYVSQQAWLQNATLRENILWGEPYDKRKYQQVIEACALKQDLDMLPGGDMTEIGEKGINLSGGQKQRVSLARAAYSNADTILLDDPLSAVDAHVGRHIFQNLIGPKGLMKGKTRVLVTHAIWVLPQMDEILVIRDGSVVERGSYTQLLKQEGDFSQFLLQHINNKGDHDEADGEELEEICNQLEETPTGQALLRQLSREGSKKEDGRFSETRRRRLTSTSSSRPVSESETDFHSSTKSLRMSTLTLDENLAQYRTQNGKILIQDEKVEIGKVKWKVYQFYGLSMGVISSLLPILCYVIAQSCQAGANVWLSRFSQEHDVGSNETLRGESFDKAEFLIAYGGFGIGQSLFFYMGSLVTWTGTLVAGKNIHQRLLGNVLRLPMSFFDTNPSGRVMNRMSKEIDVLDNLLPMFINNALSTLAQVVTTLIVIIASTPIVAIVIIPMMGMYYFVQIVYVTSARQIKRIESISKSPIFSYFSESLQGVSTIRAFRKQATFMRECQAKIDYAARAFVANIVINRWLLLRLETLGNIITFAAAIFAVAGRGSISPGIVGLSISYALSVTVMLNWLVRSTSEVEANIVSVERIQEYIEEEQEAPWTIESNRPSIVWPDNGQISFNDYQVRYRPGLDLVLKGISCMINPGEKVGIVGRTGAGKSSLTLALFRIIEAAGGSIDIDGVNISKIGLHDLRGRLTIIPQDPVLFSGTLRINLDPFDNYSDVEVWQALENAHLIEYVKSQTGGLQSTVDEGGSNLSVGQRQLVCLARALLRKSKILVLDEATAAVDLDTDDLIQATIRKEFPECTILTIAHRLNNIMDSDRVLVLDKGKIAEFSSPGELLATKDSIFYGMAQDAGLL